MSFGYIFITGVKWMEFESYLPLSEPVFYILLSLAPEARHGYAIMKDVRSLSSDRVILSTGTLYGALKRMMESGWIEPAIAEDVRDNGRERKAYRLTHLGKQILNAEIERLNHLVRVAALQQSIQRL
jgi:DNA-binding PadR family transcriptional regulator